MVYSVLFFYFKIAQKQLYSGYSYFLKKIKKDAKKVVLAFLI